MFTGALASALSAPHSFEDHDDDWVAPERSGLYRAASVGNSWGVTSIGRGFDWRKRDERDENHPPGDSVWGESAESSNPELDRHHLRNHNVVELKRSPNSTPNMSTHIPTTFKASSILSPVVTISSEPLSLSPAQSPASSRPITPISPANSPGSTRPPLSRSQTSSRSSSQARPRRRSSQQRVSLIAGRVSIAVIDPPSPPPQHNHLIRSSSATSLLSLASSTGAPTPINEKTEFLSERSISEFVIEKEIGRGAYGLVKRAREMQLDGSLGVWIFNCPSIMKANISG